MVCPFDQKNTLPLDAVNNKESPLQNDVDVELIIGITGVFLVIVTEFENAEHPKLSVMVTVYVPPEVIYMLFVLFPFDHRKVLP